MKKFKGLAALVAAIVLALSLCLAGCSLGGSGKRYSETYTGAISEESYDSEQEAVEGFLATELSGQAGEAVIVDYEVTKELTPRQAAAELSLSKEDQDGLVSAQEISVEYVEQYGSVSSLAQTDGESENRVAICYILYYERTSNGYEFVGYKYFTVAVSQDATLTKSYFDSVFDADKYLNCTMKTETSVKVNVNGQTQNLKSTGTVKYTEEACHSVSTESGVKAEMYILDTDRGIRVVMGTGRDWMDVSSSFGGAFGSVKDFILWNFSVGFGAMDHTCFQKTSKGYALREGMGEEFLRSLFAQLGDDYVSLLAYLPNPDLEYEINIAGGKISDYKMRLKCSGSINGMSFSMDEDAKVTISDFGKTKVTVPAAVKNLIG